MVLQITRLAPSPTGALHLGNARTFLISWLLARQQGWKIVLRIEDIDGPRIKRNADRELIDVVKWLGIDWDEGPIYQSNRRDAYAAALDQLIRNGFVYPCTCTRKEIELAASAPHAEDGATIYPGTCRGRYASIETAAKESWRSPALRFEVTSEAAEFDDVFGGHQAYDPPSQLGDFVVAKADGTPAYQLAVVVDDAAAHVTQVIRGDDLIDSTPRQMLIYRALGQTEQIPTYTHLPLVVGTDGRRLAKRHGDTRLSMYRNSGVSAGRLLSLLARWCGMNAASESLRAADLIDSFRLGDVSKSPIVFTDADHSELLG